MVAFIIAQITFLEAHDVVGMWLPCSGDAALWWEIENLIFLSCLCCFTFVVEYCITSDSRLLLCCPC